jgi:polyphosphate kinase
MAKEKRESEKELQEKFFNRELSWLSFARRVLAMAGDKNIPLMERVRFAGIVGMLHDEFSMKRLSGLKRRLEKGSRRISPGGSSAGELFQSVREELADQDAILGRIIQAELRPLLAAERLPIVDYDDLSKKHQRSLRDHFKRSVEPILTPLAVDAEHPFPFISNLGLNLAVILPEAKGKREQFVRVKVPDNRPRWVPFPDNCGFVPLEQVIASNLDLMFPIPPAAVYYFRATRGTGGTPDDEAELSIEEAAREPGSIVRQVSGELKARKFAGVTRLQVDPAMPKKRREWLSRQLGISDEDVYVTESIMGRSALLELEAPGRPDLSFPHHDPITHPRLRRIDGRDPAAIFEKIASGDILLHHPYVCFDTSVLRLIEAAARDPDVLAIKLTIYRTSSDSPIPRALAEAARRGKQVAVLVEITARFDEAPNIAWGQYLEKEGVHVSYGVEQLKTHVKLALVVREEEGQIRRYAHVGTGNYHSGTTRVYEDVGVLTADPEICDDVAAVFNSLTGSMPFGECQRLLVAPATMRKRFTALIRQEAEHARAGRPCGIRAKMNQLQDFEIIRELYEASQAGVPIELNIRGLCCLRPGVPGLSESIRVFGVVGRFLEHSRIFRFENGGEPEHLLGSADWMKRNLDGRVETILSVSDEDVKRQIDEILEVYVTDNASAWDCDADGVYRQRTPAEGEERCAVQEILIEMAGNGVRPSARSV